MKSAATGCQVLIPPFVEFLVVFPFIFFDVEFHTELKPYTKSDKGYHSNENNELLCTHSQTVLVLIYFLVKPEVENKCIV